MNIGYLEVRRLGRYDCFIYHDVDLIPEDLTNFYGCAKKPRHLAATRSITNYRQVRRRFLSFILEWFYLGWEYT